MELITIILSTIAIIIVSLLMKTNLKELEKIALDDKLNEIAKLNFKNTDKIKEALK